MPPGGLACLGRLNGVLTAPVSKKIQAVSFNELVKRETLRDSYKMYVRMLCPFDQRKKARGSTDEISRYCSK